MKRFLKDETGAVTVEFVIVFTAVVGMATVFADRVVIPLIHLGQQQAALNDHSVALIESAMQACPAPQVVSY
jgi:hypothetical protein